MRSQFTSYEQLPITLTADHVAAALGISRANAYILLRSDGFPTLHIGKRMVVPKDRFLQWITDMRACPKSSPEGGTPHRGRKRRPGERK